MTDLNLNIPMAEIPGLITLKRKSLNERHADALSHAQRMAAEMAAKRREADAAYGRYVQTANEHTTAQELYQTYSSDADALARELTEFNMKYPVDPVA